MTRKIFRSLCLVAFTVFLCSVVLIMGVLYDYFSRVQRTQLRMQTELAAQGVETGGTDYFDGLDVKDYRITWIGADGSVLYDSAAETGSMENHLAREEVRQALESGYGESHRYSATLTERMLYAARRLADGSVLRLAIAQSSILTMMLGVGQGFAAVILIALVLSVVLARRLSKRIVEPLNRLDLDRPLENEGYEEIYPLLRRLDAQQDQLQTQNNRLMLEMAEKTQAEQARREFTANVSHELKTPLHVISGYAELMQNGMVKPEDVGPFAGKIYDGAQQMGALLEDIMRLSHLDEGARDMPFEDTDLYELARAATEELAPAAEKAGVKLTVSGRSAPARVIPVLARSIVFDLGENGIKYNRPGGHVDIKVEPEAGCVRLTVADDGPGIPPDQQEHVFERFYRGDKSRSKDIPGTGLGLSIVKHAAQVHGAAVKLQSAPGRGAVFTVTFPAE